jgi:hypothetical protein
MTVDVYGIGAHLRSLILADSNVTAIAASRVFPNVLPQRATFPAIAYSQITSQRTSVMGVDTGTVQSTWQVDAYAQNYADARKLASAVRKALQRKAGTFPSGSPPAIAQRLIQAIFVEADTDLFEDETQLHRVSTDYVIWYQEEGE